MLAQWSHAWVATGLLAVSGCASAPYAVRPTPTPSESPQVLQLERMVADVQARDFTAQAARELQPGERVFGFDVKRVALRLAKVTERPSLPWRVFMAQSAEPNAAALPDGRIYITTGMLNYLASRGEDENELAVVLGHELAHTSAQHLVRRLQQINQQQLLLALVGIGTSVVGMDASQAGLVQDATSLVNGAIMSRYSQVDELEADQLGLRYLMRAGYDPWAAVRILEDFKRFDRGGPVVLIQGIPVPVPFLRTHPYTERRLQDVQRYLAEHAANSRRALAVSGPAALPPDALRARLLEAQRFYPPGSQSWKNIQQQLNALE